MSGGHGWQVGEAPLMENMYVSCNVSQGAVSHKLVGGVFLSLLSTEAQRSEVMLNIYFRGF